MVHKQMFQELAIYYQKFLKSSGYKTKLQYQQQKENSQNKKKRNVISFVSTERTESVKSL